MASVPTPGREAAKEELRAGVKPSVVAKKYGVRAATARRWAHEPKNIAPPPPIEPTPAEAKKEKQTAYTSLNANVCGKILRGVFLGFAIFLGPELELSAEEQRQLGESAADTLAFVPEPYASAVARASGPLLFAGTLFGVVRKKIALVAQRYTAPVPQQAPDHAVPQPPPPPPRPPVVPIVRKETIPAIDPTLAGQPPANPLPEAFGP